MLSGDRLVPQTQSATMKDLGLKFAIPMFFFEGTEDFTTPTELARKYLDAIQAPRKDFVPISGGHFAVFMNSDQFLRELVTYALPLAGSH
jgi:pimeloyl-ACP methyl ester carboxylesterase